ncbi:DNA polymerase III subunit gamma and tau, partial [Streptomyces sp. MBT65]|nr:DNA polymerase III subunit gamma and tau [Streptomyces sp. MBT65]
PQAAALAPPPAGGLDPRMLWPNILEVVKNRRRFTWILLSQNAQVTGFDGTTLQIGFVNAGARDNFNSSGSEDVLKQALTEQFNVTWKIDAIVDPSGGGTPPPQQGGSYGGGGGGGTAGGYGAGAPGGYGTPGPATTAPRPASPQPAPAPAPPNPTNSPSAPAPAPPHP